MKEAVGLLAAPAADSHNRATCHIADPDDQDGRAIATMKYSLLLSLLFLPLSACAAQPERGTVLMEHDEQAIRQWFEDWMRATQEGDLQLARSLIADDAVFLVPGADRMDKESLASAATVTDPNTEFEPGCAIQEIQMLGDHACGLAPPIGPPKE